ncbi:GlxA family transcriptional regulator [Shimia sp. CNT1-13L.2]|uniref:GlxA family transcriptional regulator n=1 Tax=Shimia sp. CNT1-13L.2 TaxID=2959663 RepID=UPI0020CE30B2|nr:GlxA family transcriptional regulator [Shimia sp. CNT1-13L.2]MCP9481698.1 GlxA family transcriptional regulator [Shimia sp. CNT1-13L.2]
MKGAKNLLPDGREPLEMAVLVMNDSNTLSFAAAVDPMRAANRRAGRTLFRWHFRTPEGRPVHLTSGLKIEGEPIAELARCDVLVMVAGFDLEAQATPRLMASLRRLHGAGTAVAAIDGAPWLLARAGVLDGHAATTHWEDLEEFATRFPNVDTRRDRYVISPPFATSGGAAPGIDMMLHLIGTRFGASLSSRIASAFLHDPAPAGALGAVSMDRRVRRNPLISKALDLMETHLEEPLSIADISDILNVSPRSLEQKFKTHLGQSPRDHYLQLRLGEAFRLASDTSMTVQDIAVATGFSSLASFARAFRRVHGLSVRELRAGQAR